MVISIAMLNNQCVNITGGVAVEKICVDGTMYWLLLESPATKIDLKTLVVDGLIKP